MSKKDLLKEKAKAKLATSYVKAEKVEETKVVTVIGNVELRNITREIKSDLDEMRDISEWWAEKKFRVNELKENIITKLMYVRDNKKSLLPDKTFESYLVDDIGLSKGYFYEQLQAYNVCLEYKKPKLFKEVDHKVLVNIAREDDKEKQKELIGKATELNRDYFKKVKPAEKVSPTDFSVKKTSSGVYSKKDTTPASIAISLIDTYKKMMEKESREDSKSAIRCMILGIQSFSTMLNDKNFISDEELSVIEQLYK
jgi:hypothetical protein